MTKKKIHPIYFNSFVGTWKRVQFQASGGVPVELDIKFNKDCTFEEITPGRGTVNGDVDEVSVEEENQYNTVGKRGKIVLDIESQKYEANFLLSSADKSKKSAVLNKLDLQEGKSFKTYVLENAIDSGSKGGRSKKIGKNKAKI